MTTIVLFDALILHVRTRSLINCIIGQMHVEIVQIFLVWALILCCCQPTQAFFVEKHSERIYAAQKHVNPQIKLEFVNQEWLVKVSLNDIVLVRIEIVNISCQKDSSTLSCRFWLRYKSLTI